jgi:hypothetical protein
MNPWTGFCLYAAATVFIQHEVQTEKSLTNLSNLEFLLAAMKAIGNRHTITTYFTTQLERDIEESRILVSSDPKPFSRPNNEFLTERPTAPKTIHNLCAYIQANRQVDPTLKGPLLAGIFNRSDRDSSPRDSPASAPISNMNSTPSSKHIEPAADFGNSSLSFFYSRPDSFKTPNNVLAECSVPTAQYGHGGQEEDFIMFPHDFGHSAS